MNLPASFAPIFVEGCRAKAKVVATDLVIGDAASVPGLPLVVCGGGEHAFTFSSEGLRFKDPEGTAVAYSWQDLDFILPGDFSVARDKLDTFTDLDVLAGQVARLAGKVCAVLAVVLLVYFIVSFIVGVVGSIFGDLDASLGTFGDILAFIVVGAIAMVLAPVAIPIAIGVFAAGGMVAVLGNAIGKNVRPLVRLGLAWRVGDFPNGIVVVNARWVKLPWGTPTTQIYDFIMLGVKLRRRGLC